jgi:hypothetical protein
MPIVGDLSGIRLLVGLQDQYQGAGGKGEYVFENRQLGTGETAALRRGELIVAAKRGCEVIDVRSGELITGCVIE